MFNYIVKVKHNNFKNRYKYLKVDNAEKMLKINSHFDVWTAVPSNRFIEGEF